MIEFVFSEGDLWTAPDPAADTGWNRCPHIEE